MIALFPLLNGPLNMRMFLACLLGSCVLENLQWPNVIEEDTVFAVSLGFGFILSFCCDN